VSNVSNGANEKVGVRTTYNCGVQATYVIVPSPLE